MKDGFAEIKRLLDERLQSRDTRLDDLEEDVADLKEWRARMQGQLVILGMIGGVVVTLAVGTLWRVLAS
jgi:hypothetical protein